MTTHFENILIDASDEDWIRVWANRQTLITQGHWFNDNIICYWDHEPRVVYSIQSPTPFQPYRIYNVYL